MDQKIDSTVIYVLQILGFEYPKGYKNVDCKCTLINISAKEAMFLIVCGYVLVHRITQIILDGFQRNVVKGWGMYQGRTHKMLVLIQELMY